MLGAAYRAVCDLSPETGELTPTLKVKRQVIGQMYAPVFDRLYAQPR